MTTRPAARDALPMRAASRAVSATGFSHSTWYPCSSAQIVRSRCDDVGVQNVDEVHVVDRAQGVPVRELWNARQWFNGGGTIHGGDDLETAARSRVVQEARDVRAARDAAQPDHRATILSCARQCRDRVQTSGRGR